MSVRGKIVPGDKLKRIERKMYRKRIIIFYVEQEYTFEIIHLLAASDICAGYEGKIKTIKNRRSADSFKFQRHILEITWLPFSLKKNRRGDPGESKVPKIRPFFNPNKLESTYSRKTIIFPSSHHRDLSNEIAPP